MVGVQTVAARRHGETDERHAARVARIEAAEQAERQRQLTAYEKQRAKEERSRVIAANRQAAADKTASQVAEFLKREHAAGRLPGVCGVFGPGEFRGTADVPHPTVIVVDRAVWGAAGGWHGDGAVTVLVEYREVWPGEANQLLGQDGVLHRLLSGRGTHGGVEDYTDFRRYKEDLTVPTDNAGGRPLVTLGYFSRTERVWFTAIEKPVMAHGADEVVRPRSIRSVSGTATVRL